MTSTFKATVKKTPLVMATIADFSTEVSSNPSLSNVLSLGAPSLHNTVINSVSSITVLTDADVPYTGSQVSINSNGYLEATTTSSFSLMLKLQMMYEGATFKTNAFNVTVYCPSFVMITPTVTSYNFNFVYPMSDSSTDILYSCSNDHQPVLA